MDPTDDSDPQRHQGRYARILSSYQSASDAVTGKTPASREGHQRDENHSNGVKGVGLGKGHPLQDASALHYCPMNENLLPFKFLYFFFRGGVACIVPYSTVFLGLLSASPATTGVLLGVPRLATAVVTPLCGVLADKFQCRKFVLLLCMSLWLVPIVCVNFLGPLRPAACPDVMEHLQNIAETLPRDSLEYQRWECTMNGSAYMQSLLSGDRRDSANRTDGSHFEPIVSLYHLPADPFTTSLNGKCAATAATRHHDVKPINGLRQNLETFGELFLPRVEYLPNVTVTDTGWLFDSTSLRQTFSTVFLLMGFGEVMHRPTMALTDTATLNELGQQSWDRYGWQRSFGSAGFAFYSILIAFFLGLMRFPLLLCGLEIDIVDYRIGTVMFGGTVATAFGLLFACCFKFKYYTNAEYRFSNVLPAFCSLFYGSIMLTGFVLAVCNGCVAGFLFWHLRNLGATEINISLMLAVRAASELLLAFHTPRLIGYFGHVVLLGVGLLVYSARFLCYAYLTVPWLTLPVEVLHGMSIALTWNILVSFMSRAVPFECMATLQGFLSGVYFGLGHGIGAIGSGYLVHSFGAQTTFYGFSFAVLCYAVIFMFTFKAFEPPRIPPNSYQLVTSKDPPW